MCRIGLNDTCATWGNNHIRSNTMEDRVKCDCSDYNVHHCRIDKDTPHTTQVSLYMTKVMEAGDEDCILDKDLNCVQCFKTEMTQEFEDNRSDLQICKDIIQCLNFNYCENYKNLVDKSISRDSSVPEIENNITRSKHEIRKICRNFRKKNKESLMKDIEDDKAINQDYANFMDTAMQTNAQLKEDLEKIRINMSMVHNHLPKCQVALMRDNNTPFIVPAILDTGASNFLIPFSIILSMGYTKDMIKNTQKYSLNTAIHRGKNVAVLGDIQIEIGFQFKGEWYVTKVTAIILKTSLKSCLLDIQTLRNHQYRIQFQNNVETLFLKMSKQGCTKKEIIEIDLNYQENNTVYMSQMKDHDSILPDRKKASAVDDDIYDLQNSDMDYVIDQRHGIDVEEADDDYLHYDFRDCTIREKEGLEKIFQKYDGIFGKHRYDTGNFWGFYVTFPTQKGAWISQKPRRYNKEAMEQLDYIIKRLIANNILEPVGANRAFNNNVLCIPKLRKQTLADKYDKKNENNKNTKNNFSAQGSNKYSNTDIRDCTIRDDSTENHAPDNTEKRDRTFRHTTNRNADNAAPKTAY